MNIVDMNRMTLYMHACMIRDIVHIAFVVNIEFHMSPCILVDIADLFVIVNYNHIVANKVVVVEHLDKSTALTVD